MTTILAGYFDLQRVNEEKDSRCHDNKQINVGNSSANGYC